MRRFFFDVAATHGVSCDVARVHLHLVRVCGRHDRCSDASMLRCFDAPMLRCSMLHVCRMPEYNSSFNERLMQECLCRRVWRLPGHRSTRVHVCRDTFIGTLDASLERGQLDWLGGECTKAWCDVIKFAHGMKRRDETKCPAKCDSSCRHGRHSGGYAGHAAHVHSAALDLSHSASHRWRAGG